MRQLINKLVKNKLLEEYNIGYALGLTQGKEQGKKFQKEVDDELVDKLVADRFSEKNLTLNVNNLVYASPSGNLYVAREILTAIEIKALKEEVDYIKNSRLYKIFNELVRDQAIKKSVLNATEWEHVLAGKMMIHNLGILNWIIERVEKAPQAK